MKNEKASQKTEDEVINETFGGFDEDMTEQTMDQTESPEGAAPFEKKKTGSSNTLVFAGAGIAAVAVLGWMFFIKPAMTPNNQQAAQPDPVVAASNTSPVSPTVPSSLPANPETPESRAAAQFLSGQINTPNTTTQNPVVAPVVPMVTPVTLPTVTSSTTTMTPANTAVNPANTTVTVTTNQASLPVVASAVKPVVENKAPDVAITKNNATSAAVVNELSGLFETQSKQFKIALDDMGNKVQSLENFKAEQKVINKNVEERLVKLETMVGENKPVMSAKPQMKKQAVARAPVNKFSKPVKSMKNDSNILVDKTDVVVMEKRIITKEVEVMQDFNIHSIYGNRVWLKNADGSLSTYSSGEKLPSGELIKSIDDEKFSVTTDKRKFSKR